MHGATHVTAGMAAGLTTAVIIGETRPGTLVLYVAVGGLSGLIPDWIQVNLPGASDQLKGTFGHRGFSHWVWTPLVISLLLVSRSSPNAPDGLIFAFAAGWLSHILLDALAGGVPAFWPFGRLTLGHVKTGGKIDKFTGGAALVSVAVIGIARVFFS